jgi:Trehalose utilisation
MTSPAIFDLVVPWPVFTQASRSEADLTIFLTGCTVPLHLLLPVFVRRRLTPGHIYSDTAGLRHESIARDALTMRGRSINVQFDATEDKISHTNVGLASYDVLIFLMNTSEGRAILLGHELARSDRSWGLGADARAVLDVAGRAALQWYLVLGGNFVAIHPASDCLRNTTFYGREVGELRQALFLGLAGAFFDYHPVIQNAVCLIPLLGGACVTNGVCA